MHWIYLSPHLDDVVYSCGGLIWQQTRSGDRVEIWTVCAGDPPEGPLSAFAQELHERWETPQDSVERRRAEDRAACHIVGAAPRHLPLPDCIYRQPGLDYWKPGAGHPDAVQKAIVMYPDRDALFGPLHTLEADLPEQTALRLKETLPAAARVAAPLTLGGHVDHRLTRLAAERLSIPGGVWYYADYPYAAESPDWMGAPLPPGWRKHTWALENGALEAWIAGAAAYASQISTFWSGPEELRARLEDYSRRLGGAAIWGPA